jgi:hypothetical protein
MKDFDEDEKKKKEKNKQNKKHSSDFKLIAIAVFFWIFSPRK